MSSVEEKWQANQAKVAFVKQFPGLLTDWNQCQGKTIKRVMPLIKSQGAVLLMEDGTFAVVPKLSPDPVELQEGLKAAKNELQGRYAQAYTELDRLTARDRELTRRSRLEKILGAIQNNISDIPELKQELKKLLDRLPN